MKAAPPSRSHRAARALAAGPWLKGLLLQLATLAERDAARCAASPEAATHSLRRRMKKLQSLIRLGTPAADHDTVIALRAAARLLKGAVAARRDADVLTGLRRKFGGDGPAPRRRKGPETPALLAFAAEITSLVQQLDLSTLSWEMVAASHRKTCRRARRAWREASGHPTTEALHTWRMRVKDLYHQSLALHRWLKHPQRLRRTRRLGSLLGRCHDLDLYAGSLSGNGPHRKLRAKLRSRRKKLTRRILCRGRKVFGVIPASQRDLARDLPQTPAAAGLRRCGPRRRCRAHPAPRSR